MRRVRTSWMLPLLVLVSPCFANKPLPESVQQIQQRITALDRQLETADDPSDTMKPENAVAIDTVWINGAQRPVYFNKTERVLFVTWMQDKRKPVTSDFTNPLEERLKQLARKQGIERFRMLQHYRSDSSNPASVLLGLSDETLPPRRLRLQREKALLERSRDQACKQVHHKPIVVSGHKCEVSSDAARQSFLILMPRNWNPTVADQGEIHRYVGGLSDHSLTSWSTVMRPK